MALGACGGSPTSPSAREWEERNALIVRVIQSETSAPVEGATVTIRFHGQTETKRSDASGRVEWTVGRGTYEVLVEYNDWSCSIWGQVIQDTRWIAEAGSIPQRIYEP